MTPQVARFVEERLAEFDQISPERKQQLQALGAFVETQRAQGAPARFTFVCTHNSRRSHLAQIWAAVAAAHYGLDNVETFSGGTEVTAF
ncbi:MAG: protein-tyrosine-phosphatase, partial [Planctomycetota bacterium]